MRRLAPLLALLAACSGPAPGSTASLELREYAISSTVDTLAAGLVTLGVTNVGEFPHPLVITAADGSVVAAIDPLTAGSTGSMVVDLTPGAYRVSCRIVVQRPDGSIADHYQEGMVRRLEVVG